jgi:hypothetical protein
MRVALGTHRAEGEEVRTDRIALAPFETIVIQRPG